MGQKISRIIIWIFSFGKSSDSDNQQNETLPSPPHLPINSSSSTNIRIRFDSDNNNVDFLQSSLGSSSRSYSILADINQCDLHVDRFDSVVEIRSSASEYHASFSHTSNSICDSDKEFAYSRSNRPVGEFWINHYSSEQRILFVGDGDFSFSACLGKAFGFASKLIATSLDSLEFLQSNYARAMSNIQILKDRGCIVLHGVDATRMASHLLLNGIRFDRIIFNFPHAGFYKNEPRWSQIIRHQVLVRGFLENAKKMMSENGEIHITHKPYGFFTEWKIEVVALACGLQLVEDLHFDFRDYPGYHTKYGFGGDKNFNCNPSRIYKFACRMSDDRHMFI